MMKKYLLIGTLFGFFLSLAVTTHAQEIENMIGKVCEGVFAVQVDGVKLDKDAVVIDGTTYLPVRSFGEALGYDVTFDTDMGVKMVKKTDPEKQKKLEIAKIERAIKSDKNNLDYYNERVNLLTDELKSYPSDKPEYASGREQTTSEIEKAKTEISRLEAEIADLQAQLNELNKQQ